ncbi:MAG: RNA polymerase sigma factor [Vicinamibacterales bacterium]
MTSQPRDRGTPVVDFDSLYRQHGQEVHRFALFLSGDRSMAEDLVSEAFLRMWTARERVELATVRGYLFAIVRNLFLKDIQRKRRHVPLADRLAAGGPDQEDRAAVQSNLRTVLVALASLPEIDRAAVLMRADDALPYEEIARVLRISIGAAKVRVHRARLKLAEALDRAPGKE